MNKYKFEINILKEVYKNWSINLYQLSKHKTYLVVISYFDINTTEVKLFNNLKDAKNSFMTWFMSGRKTINVFHWFKQAINNTLKLEVLNEN